MENLKEKCMDLMAQKIDLLNRIVALTRAEKFTGNEDNVEAEVGAFIDLFEKRTAIIARIEKIDDALGLLDPFDETDLFDNQFQDNIVNFREQARAIATEMIALDRANAAAVEKLSMHLKQNMKNIRQTREINHRYLDDFETTGGSFLDKKN